METGAGGCRDWSALPLDALLIAMSSMEVPDVVRSGAVCTTWRSVYAAFRALGLPTPRQPPCLLYYASDAPGPGASAAAALYSPSTGVTFRVPLHEHRCGGGFLGSAHGWLFTTDEAANPYLLNPLTGARAALPPITSLERVRGSFVAADDDDAAGGGGLVYNVDFGWRSSGPQMQQVTARRAREWMYRRVAVSASPLAAACRGDSGDASAACIVLLVHMPYEELSFARPGDDRWTSLSDLIPSLDRGYFSSAVYSERDGLFYVLRATGSVHAIDLRDPSSPAAWLFTCTMTCYLPNCKCTGYLIPMPCGLLLLVTRSWCRSGETPADISGGRSAGDRDETRTTELHKHVITTSIRLDVIDVDRFRVERLAGPRDHALFLGSNSALYLPIKNLPLSLSTPNCAYLTDDVDSDTFHSPISRRDVGVWDFGSGSMNKLGDVWPLRPWLDFPAPIWITPSLC